MVVVASLIAGRSCLLAERRASRSGRRSERNPSKVARGQAARQWLAAGGGEIVGGMETTASSSASSQRRAGSSPGADASRGGVRAAGSRVALDHLVLALAPVRRLTAVALVLAAVLVVAGVAITPRDDGTTAGLLDAIAAAPGRTEAGDFLLHFGWTALTLACLGLVLLGASRRGPLLIAGALLAALGLTTMPGVFATDAYDLAIAQELPRAVGVVVSDAAASSPLAATLYVSGALGAALAPVLLFAALWRGGLLRWHAAVVTVVGPLVSFVGDSMAMTVLGASLLGAGYCLAAWELTRGRD